MGKGESESGDWTQLGMSIGGAAIGSMIAPGAGTAIGWQLGSMGGKALSGATGMESSGEGIAGIGQKVGNINAMAVGGASALSGAGGLAGGAGLVETAGSAGAGTASGGMSSLAGAGANLGASSAGTGSLTAANVLGSGASGGAAGMAGIGQGVGAATGAGSTIAGAGAGAAGGLNSAITSGIDAGTKTGNSLIDQLGGIGKVTDTFGKMMNGMSSFSRSNEVSPTAIDSKASEINPATASPAVQSWNSTLIKPQTFNNPLSIPRRNYAVQR